MSVCACCGMRLAGFGLCPRHHSSDDGWAATNRVMCDLLHRGIAAVRLRASDRDALCDDQHRARPAETFTTAA